MFPIVAILIWSMTPVSLSRNSPPPHLRWPLEIHAGLTASFGEYRGDHFHGGVDLSTRGEKGWKVQAAADGEVHRLKVEWRGYGKAVYVRHTGGWVTVYAHLDRLENGNLHLEDRLEWERQRRGDRFPGDIFLAPPLPVSAGQVLGWTGETGAGAPHLHFELRDPQDRPVDPVRAVPGWYRDRRPPVLQSLVLTAATVNSFLDGNLRRKQLPLQLRGGEYLAEGISFVEGPVVATLHAMDPGPSSHRLGLGGLRSHLENRDSYYELDLASLSFSEFPQAGLVFDLVSSQLSPPAYGYALVRRAGNRLARGTGEIRLEPEGMETLRLEAWDASGNRSRGRVLLLGGKAPRLQLLRVFRRGPDLEASFQSDAEAIRRIEEVLGEPLRLEIEVGPDRSGRFRPLFPPRPLPASPFRIEGEGATNLNGGFFRGRLHAGGFHTPWSTVAGRTPPPIRATTHPKKDPEWRLDHFGRFADLRFRFLPIPSDPPSVQLQGTGSGDRITFAAPWDGDWFVARIPLEGIVTSPVIPEILIPRGDETPETRQLPLVFFPVTPDRVHRIERFGIHLDFPKGALFGPETIALHPWSLPRQEGLRVSGGPIRILPEGLAFRRRVLMQISDGNRTSRPERLGIYRWDGKKDRWTFQGPASPIEGSFDRAWTRRTGIFALLEDISPPEIIDQHPNPGSTLPPERCREMWASVREVGKGLDWNGVHFLLDGVTRLAEYDPDRHSAFLRLEEPLPPGDHTLVIRATDRAGNSSPGLTVPFRVTEPVKRDN